MTKLTNTGTTHCITYRYCDNNTITLHNQHRYTYVTTVPPVPTLPALPTPWVPSGLFELSGLSKFCVSAPAVPAATPFYSEVNTGFTASKNILVKICKEDLTK